MTMKNCLKKSAESSDRIPFRRDPTVWITDMDGTLTTLDIDWENIRNEVRRLLKTNHPLRPLAASVNLATDDENLRRMIFRYLEEVELNAAMKAQRQEELIGLLDSFARKGIRMGLVTLQARVSTNLILDRLGVLRFFQTIISRDDSVDRIEQLKIAVSRLATGFEEVIFTGDSPWDIKAGKSLGCFTVAVGKPIPGADAFIESILDLRFLMSHDGLGETKE